MPSAEDLYQFRHMVLQQAAYELHTPSARARLHRYALDLVEATGSPASELAEHALAAMIGAGEAEKEALTARRKQFLRQAAEDSLAHFRNDESLYFLDLVAQHDLSDAEAVDNHCRAAEILYRLGRGALAVPRADRALEIARRAGEAPLLARAHAARGMVCMDSARNAESVTHLRASVEHFRQGGETKALATTLARLSSAVWLSGNPEAALPIATEAVTLSGGLHVPAQMNILNILMQLGRMEEAKARAAELRKHLDAAKEAYMVCIMGTTFGILHDYLGELDQAQAYYEKVCVAAREAGILAELARGLNNLGGVFAGKRQFVNALARQSEAEGIAREIGDSRICWYALRGQGDALTEIGDHRSAIERNLAAVRIADQATLPDLAMQARVAAGESYVELHQPEDAAEILQAALDSPTCAYQPTYAVLAHAALARAKHRLGNDGKPALAEAERLLAQVLGRNDGQVKKSMKAARAEVGEPEA